jgi:hypothetical protein
VNYHAPDSLHLLTREHPIERQHQPDLLGTLFDPMASKDAAVATAACRVLANIVATAPKRIARSNRANLFASLVTEYAKALASIPDSPFKSGGIAAGPNPTLWVGGVRAFPPD